MRYCHVLVLLFVFATAVPATVFGQIRPKGLAPQSSIFRNYRGFKTEHGETRMEGEGYSIVISAYKSTPDEQNFEKVANSLHPQKILKKELTNNPLTNYVVDCSMPKATPAITNYHYLYGGKSNNIIDVSVSSYSKINTARIEQVVSSIFFDGVYDSMLIDPASRSVDFINHKMEFVDDCAWVKPNMIKCGRNGSVTWHLYNTLAEAEAARKDEMALARAFEGGNKEDSTKVTVLFEGKEVIANKFLFTKEFMDLTPKNGKSLYVYYVAAEVSGRAVFCRLAFPVEEPKIPFFIARIMRLK